MKKIYFAFILTLGVLAFSSCGDKEYTDTKVTNYVTYELTGGETYTIPVGTAYTDPGYKAYEGTEDVTASVQVSGTVDGNTVGFYPISYSAVNSDGFSRTVTRNVFVYNPAITTDLAGDYLVSEGSHRIRGAAKTAYSGQKITLTKVAPGMFYITDWLGGYYDQRAGYGSSYALYGYLGLNADNTISGLYGFVKGWGDSFSDVTGTYDPATGTVSMVVTYAEMEFHVILNK